MKRPWLPICTLAFVVALGFTLSAPAEYLTRCSAHITSATSTTPTNCAGVTGHTIEIWHGSICVDAGGVQTAITIQDGAGTNLVGTNVVYVLPAGSCLSMQMKPAGSYFVPTAAGQGLVIVTGAAGPVEVYLEVAK